VVEQEVLDKPRWLGIYHPLDECISCHRRNDRCWKPAECHLHGGENAKNHENAKIFKPEDLPRRLGDDCRSGHGQVLLLPAGHELI